MEKSMVHELNPLISSQVQFSRQQFIHTVYESDFNQLRKSRIQNLPNYRKQDLSGKLNFVVVFQGIQIQRLSVQVETLRVKLKDYERQVSNYQNYQVQIRQLTQRCHSYEMQRQDHQYNMQKMQRVCQQLYNELQDMRQRYSDIDLSLKQKYRLQKQRCQTLMSQVQKWKVRYNASESSKLKQLQDMRMMLQNQRKSMLQRQLRQLSVKYQSQRKMLQNQLRKLRETLQNKNSQVQRIKFQFQQSRIKQSQFKHYQATLVQYQDKLMMMAQQNMRLNQLLRMKKQQIQNLKNNQRNLQNKLISFKKIQDQFNQVNKRIQNYQIQIRQWNQKYSRLQAQNNKNNILSNKAQQYQKLLDKSADQMQRMNTIIRQKISQVQKWKSQTQRLTLQIQHNKLNQGKIAQYQNQISNIMNENSRLSDILKDRLQQIQNWKIKYSQIQTKLPLFTQSQNQCKNLNDKLTVQINIRTQLSQRLKTMQNDLAKAGQMQQNLIRQRSLNNDLHKQIQRLNNSIRNISTQNNDYSKKIQTIQIQLRQNSGLTDQITQCKRKIISMTQQLDRINGILHEKIQQLRQLKQNYNSININAGRYRAIEEQFVMNLQQTQQLVLKLDEARRQKQCIQQKAFNLQSICKRLQSDILNSNDEKEKLVSIINQRKKDIDDYILRLEQSDMKNSQLMQIQSQYKNLKNSYSNIQQKCNEWENRFNSQTKRSQQLSLQIQNLTVQVNKLKNQQKFSKQFINQFISIKRQSQQKDRMIVNLLERINRIQKIIIQLKQQNKKNYNNMCAYKQKWVQLNNNFQTISVFFNRYLELQQKIQGLAQKNIQLESSVRVMNATLQMNVQMAQSSYANKDWVKKSQFTQQNTYTPLSNKTQISSNYFRSEQIRPKSSITPSENQSTNFYQSQVRQVSNGYLPNYSNVQNYPYTAPNQRHASYTVKTLKPGSNEMKTTYSYNQYNSGTNNGFGSNQTINNNYLTPQGSGYLLNNNSQYNNTINERSLSSNNMYKYQTNQVRTTTTTNDQMNNNRRTSVISPVRYLN